MVHSMCYCQMKVTELIQKLILEEISLSQGLMLAKVLYKDSLSESSYQWICNELDHYEDAGTIPEYRVLDCVLKARISGYYYGTRIEELDTAFINKQLEGTDKTYASPNKMLIRQGIESIEKSLESAGPLVEMALYRNQVELMMEYYSIPPGCRVEKMYQECRIEQVRNIIPSVRNKLISILEEMSTVVSQKEETGDKKKVVFISYGWDDDEHREWVSRLAERLRAYFEVLIDEEQPLGTELNVFMEQLVTRADRVLMILTPKYKEKADARQNGVGYESVLISSQLYRNQGTTKFIPVIRRSEVNECYPLYLGNRKGIDMRDDYGFEEQVKALVKDIADN